MSLESELNDLAPSLRERVKDMIDDCPFPVGITSAWRSYSEQKRLYEGWKARKPGFNPANPPGMSKHEVIDRYGNPASEAADLNYYGNIQALAWIQENAKHYGLHFNIPRENWHVESNGQPYRSMEETVAKLDAEDLGNIKKIVDAETNDIYWRILGVPEGTPWQSRPTLKDILNKLDE